MTNYTDYTYETALKADGDVHAGGNLFWSLYKDVLILKEDSTAVLKRVYYNTNVNEITKESAILTGEHHHPSKGYYLFDLELKNEIVRKIWSCDFIDSKRLVCHGATFYLGKNSVIYETELFEKVV